MFGKKKKQAQLEAERQQQEALKLQEQLSAQPVQEAPIAEPEAVQEDNSLPKEYESIAYILKQETGEDLMALPVGEDDEIADVDLEELPEFEELLDEPEEEAITEEEEEEQEEPQAPVDPQPAQQEEEVVYVVDGPTEDDDEIVKPAKLVKLPNLVDYMLSQNMSKKMKINIATLLLSAYAKYKDIPAEKKIVVQCMAKVMRSLMQDAQ